MNLNLCELLKHPAAYQSSDISIWTDEYISTQMLSAHLDPNFEGASRKHSFIDQSIAWIQKETPPSQHHRLINVGCGPGIYAERLCKAGYQVTGMDFSKRSIDYAVESANKQGLDIDYLHQNYLNMDFDSSFDLATFIYCDYGALSDDDRKAILKKIYRSLKNGGKLILDVFSMTQFDHFEESKTWEICPHGGFWCGGEYLEINESYKYSETITLRQTMIATKNTVRSYYLWDTYFTSESLIQEAQALSFKVCGLYGDVAGKPLTEERPTIAVILQK